MINLDSILKSRDINLPKVHIVKAMVLLLVMYICESWTMKKAEYQRTDASKLWCWKRLLRVPWTERGSNQLILKEINPEHSLEGLMLKLQYFGHLMWRSDSLEKTLMLGGIEGRRIRRQQRMRWLDGITDAMDMSLSKLLVILKDREICYVVVHGVTNSQTQLSGWTAPPTARWISLRQSENQRHWCNLSEKVTLEMPTTEFSTFYSIFDVNKWWGIPWIIFT